MSIVAFKKKSVIQYGSKRSGKPPGGYWLPQGPFGASTIGLQQAINYPGPVGFSLNGSHRNVGYVGKESKFSKNGTPFRGVHAYGSGGHLGRYARPEPVYNVNEVIVLGDQYLYIKPTVLTTKGMLAKKYRWAYNGQYPNNWVQPVNDGTTQSDTKSQGMYLHDLTTANICVTDINNSAKYVGYIKRGGPTLCETSTARFKYNDMARNGPYTKELRQAETSSQHTLRIQRRCANPLPYQKPFPYAVNTGTGILTGGINVTSVGNSGSCSSSNQTYTIPPPNYLTEPSPIN
jgi:hypothetical protein